MNDAGLGAPTRPPVGYALVAYAAAFALMNCASTVLVLGVALDPRSAQSATLGEEAASFA